MRLQRPKGHLRGRELRWALASIHKMRLRDTEQAEHAGDSPRRWAA